MNSGRLTKFFRQCRLTGQRFRSSTSSTKRIDRKGETRWPSLSHVSSPSPNINDGSSSSLSYREILSGIEERKIRYLNVQGGRFINSRNIVRESRAVSYRDFVGDVGVGDLILEKHSSGPMVIIEKIGDDDTNDNRNKKSNDDNNRLQSDRELLSEKDLHLEKDFLACDSTGNIQGINKSDIILRMGQLVSPVHLYSSVEIINVDGSPIMCLNNTVKRGICPNLRIMLTSSYSEWDEILLVVQRLFDQIQLRRGNHESVNIAFFQLAQEVERCVLAHRQSPESFSTEHQSVGRLAGEFPSPIFNHSSKMKKNQQQQYQEEQEQKHIRDTATVDATFLYTMYEVISTVFDRRVLLNQERGELILTLLSQDKFESFDFALNQVKSSSGTVEKKKKRSISHAEQEQSDNQISEQQISDCFPLLQRYALGDINPHDIYAQSAAISLLRRISHFNDGPEKLQPDVALELHNKLGLTDNKYGPFIDSDRFEFLKKSSNNKQSSSSNPVTFGPILFDRMESIREDLGKDIPVYCIDAIDSHEIDDGISVTDLGSKLLVGVHIADPSSSFKDLNDDDILRQAYYQTSTAYFPTGPVTMLPLEFSNKFSLENRLGLGPRRCFTISFIYDKLQKQMIEGSLEIRPQSINKVINITYDKVNELLKGHNEGAINNNAKQSSDDLRTLYQVAATLQNSRREKGAINLNIPAASAKVHLDSSSRPLGSNDIKVSIESSSSPAHVLVSELMIMANSQIADYTKQNLIPNIYRSQAIVFDNNELRKIHRSYIKGRTSNNLSMNMSFKLLDIMGPSLLSPQARMHQSLGVSSYCGATSPLRRFQDIITHWQVYSHLLGQQKTNEKISSGMLTEEQIYTASSRLQMMQGLIKSAQTKSNKYWILRKLENVVIDSSRPLIVRCIVASTALTQAPTQRIYLSDWGIYGRVDISQDDKPLVVGEQLTCRLTVVNADRGILLLSKTHNDDQSADDILLP